MMIKNLLFVVLILLSASMMKVVADTLSKDDLSVDFVSLARAAEIGDVISTKYFLNVRKIDPDGYDFSSGSMLAQLAVAYARPLQLASQNGHFKVVKLLLDRGASPDWCCCECVTALHFALEKKHEKIANLLIRRGANTNLPYHGKDREYSCLELAEKNGLKSTVKLIVDQRK